MSELDDVIADNRQREREQRETAEEAQKQAAAIADPATAEARKRADDEKREELRRLGVRFDE